MSDQPPVDPTIVGTTLAEVCEHLAFLTPLAPAAVSAMPAPALIIAVRTLAPDRGRVLLALGPGVADELARNLGALPPGAEVPAADGIDAARELANVLAGNLLPRLFGDAVEVRLDEPRVVLAARLPDHAAVVELAEGFVAAWTRTVV